MRLALPTRAASLPKPEQLRPSKQIARPGAFAHERPLFAPFAAAWLAFAGIGVLLHSAALRVYPAGELSNVAFIRDTAYALSPDVLLGATRAGFSGITISLLYLFLAVAALASWCWAVRTAAHVTSPSPRNLLILTALLSIPALGFVGLFSDDVYLYNLYGRTIATYGANPIVHPPATYGWDPHLSWVHWKDLPSSYGPAWLMLSAALSGLAPDSITAVVLVYRLAALAIHLATAAAVWFVLRQTSPRDALAGTVFYAWNPLVIVEVVGNAHNDVLVAMFGVLLIAATVQRAWVHAAFFGACAMMVKPFAALLLPGLALRIYQTRRDRWSWIRQTAGAIGIGAISMTAMSLPLFAGLRLIDNISGNPASHFYTNSLWELASEAGPAWFSVPSWQLQQHLDAVRTAGFFVGAAWILSRRWTRRGAAHVALSFWLLFILTASWIWPWYFVPAIALATVARGAGLAAATALTAGGLLFWAAWPAPSAIPGLYTFRALILLGPVVGTLAVPAVRAWILDVLGAHRRPGTDDVDLLGSTIPAATAAGSRPTSAAAAS